MKTEIVRVRCLPSEKDAWEKAAGHGNFSRWARALLNEAARKQQGVQTKLIDDEDEGHPQWA